MARCRVPRLIFVALGLLAVASASSAAADTARTEVTVSPAGADLEIDGDAAAAAPPETAESFTFQAEVNRLMDIIINSLYSNRDVFLRELISNAADALDKLRFLSLTKDGQAIDEDSLHIRVRGDEGAGILQIEDTGVGMTKDELIKNLGTIAKSGTSSFLDRLGTAAKEAALQTDKDAANNLIGQFGVGFYSAYLVANKVRVESRVDGGALHVWESGADEKFVVYESSSTGFPDRGTRISLFLKDDAKEYLQESKLSSLIKKYSQFINFPIYLRTSENVEVPIEEAEEEKPAEEESDGSDKAEDEDEDIVVTDGDEEEKKDEKDETPKTRTETRLSWTLMNENKPIWTRDPNEITDEDYKAFYDGISKLPGEPMSRAHFKGEGEVEFRSILYIPDKPPVGLYSGAAEEEKDAIRLYVRRVLVTDKFETGLVPRYLAFLIGIVDSDDLPINVSREMLQKSKTLDIIRRKLVRKALEMMKGLVKKDDEAAEKEKEEGAEKAGEDGEEKKSELRPYIKFWNSYGKSLKLGVIEDHANRARLAKLLRFRTSNSDMDDVNDWKSLDQYMDGMKDDQDNIYYLSGENVEEIKKSPFLEKLLAKGYEVLYLTEPIDEHMVTQLPDYEGTKFMSVAKDNFKFGDKDQKEEKEKIDVLKKHFKPLTKFLKKRMSDKVSKVKLSSRLSDTPCVLSTEQYGYSARMEIIMKAQAFADPSSFAYMAPKTKVMELNPHHPVVKQMLVLAKDAVTAEGDDAVAAEEKVLELGHLVYDTALVSAGYLMNDNADFSKRMYKWIATSVGVDPDAPVVEEFPEPEEEDSDAKDDAIDLDDMEMPDMKGMGMPDMDMPDMADGEANDKSGDSASEHDEL